MRNSQAIACAKYKNCESSNNVVIVGNTTHYGIYNSIPNGVSPKSPLTYHNYAKKVRGPDRYYDLCADNTKGECDQWALNSSHSIVFNCNPLTPNPNNDIRLFDAQSWDETFVLAESNEQTNIFVEYKTSGVLHSYSGICYDYFDGDPTKSSILNDIAPLSSITQQDFPVKVIFENNKVVREIVLANDCTKIPNNLRDINPKRVLILHARDKEIDLSGLSILAAEYFSEGLYVLFNKTEYINFSNCNIKRIMCAVNFDLEKINVDRMQFGDENNQGYEFTFSNNPKLPPSEIDKLIIGAYESNSNNGTIDITWTQGPSANISDKIISLIDRGWNIII